MWWFQCKACRKPWKQPHIQIYLIKKKHETICTYCELFHTYLGKACETKASTNGN